MSDLHFDADRHDNTIDAQRIREAKEAARLEVQQQRADFFAEYQSTMNRLKKNRKLTKAHILNAIRKLKEKLPKMVTHPDNMQWKEYTESALNTKLGEVLEIGVDVKKMLEN